MDEWERSGWCGIDLRRDWWVLWELDLALFFGRGRDEDVGDGAVVLFPGWRHDMRLGAAVVAQVVRALAPRAVRGVLTRPPDFAWGPPDGVARVVWSLAE